MELGVFGSRGEFSSASFYDGGFFMKTSVKLIRTKYVPPRNGVAIPDKTESRECICVDGDTLKTGHLRYLAQHDLLLEIPEALYREILMANEEQSGHYNGLLNILRKTTAYKEAPWREQQIEMPIK